MAAITMQFPAPGERSIRGEKKAVPLVSVIIPNYNHSAYLPRRIKSVLEQTFTDYEIIFLDDASTDDSVPVARGLLARVPVDFVVNDKNTQIPFKQWNKGVSRANGRFIWIAESDDFADPTFLEKTVRVLLSNPNVGVVYTQSWQVDESDRTLGSILAHTDDISKERWRSDFVNDGKAECLEYLCLRNTIPNASACLMRKAVYIGVGMAPTHLRQCGDWLLWIRMLLHSDIFFIAEHLNYFRKHERSVRASMEQSAGELVEVYQVLAFLSSKVPLAAKECEQSCCITFQRWRSLAGPFRFSSSWLYKQAMVYRKARMFDREIERRILAVLRR
jgi:glycosyltransferase involved in cell wall biosynthesis